MRVALYWFWLAYRSVISILLHLDIVPSKLHADHRMSALSSNIFFSQGNIIGRGYPKYKASPSENPASLHVIKVSTVRESMSLSDPGLRNISKIQERGG